MKREKINDPIKLDPYATRGKEHKVLNKADNIYASKWFGNIAVALFCFIDFWCMQTIWNLVSKPENFIFIYAVAIGCAVALDVPLAIAGHSLKAYHQGLKSKNENAIILILSISVFLIAFICSFMFRVETKDLSYQLQSSNLVNTLGAAETPAPEATQTAGQTILIASIFNGIIPLLTSISSFVISYFAYSPLKEKIMRLERRLISLDSNIIEAKTAIAQAETAEEYCNTLLMKEEDLYMEHIDRINAEGECIKQTAKLVIMEKLGDADSVSAVTQSAKAEVSKNNVNPAPEYKLPTYITEKLATDNSTSPQEECSDSKIPDDNPVDFHDDLLQTA